MRLPWILYQGSATVSSMSKGASLNRTYSFSGGALGQDISPIKTTNFTSNGSNGFAEQDGITVLSTSCGGQGLLGINIIAQSSLESSIDISKIVISSGELSPC
ncbi:hypothetical protein [Nostoc sp.]|uniref:hypothetical protein n=1 Tax=Nostoc sp. TaxID=1180 RepID=UPI002FFD1947